VLASPTGPKRIAAPSVFFGGMAVCPLPYLSSWCPLTSITNNNNNNNRDGKLLFRI